MGHPPIWRIKGIEVMAVTTLLSVGYVQPMVQNQVYALPARHCKLFTDTAAATLVQSDTLAFTVSVTLTLTDGQADVAGGFIKCTSGAINISLKPY